MEFAKLFREYWVAWGRHPRERGKLALGCLLYPRVTYEWLSYLRTDPHLRHQALQHPKLATRIYRPYALRSLDCRGRVAHIVQHHSLLRRLGWSQLTTRTSNAPWLLFAWGEGGSPRLELRLLSLLDAHREGEAHLHLNCGGERLFSLTFLVRSHMGLSELLVTRLQGSRDPAASEWIRSATKRLHGLRPVDLLIQVAQHLAQVLGCHRVLLVSNRERVALNPMRRWRIKADLDRLWRERGAQVTDEGLFYLMPGVTVRSEFSDVTPNKRAQARRRADLLRQLLQSVNQGLDDLRATTGAAIAEPPWSTVASG